MPVRPARSEDLPRIADIHVRSWQAAYAGLIPQHYLDSLDPARRLDGWAAAAGQTAGPHGALLVAVGDDDQAVGFAHVRECRDPDQRDPAAGEVWAIYLEPGAWGQAIGQELMAAAVTRLAELGYRQASLWALDGNARARRFYQAAGFRPDGAVKIDGERGFTLREIRYRKRLG